MDKEEAGSLKMAIINRPKNTFLFMQYLRY